MSLDASQLLRRGHGLFRCPADLREASREVYQVWDRFMTGPERLSAPSDRRHPAGFLPICGPDGCDMKESFYVGDGVPLPPALVGATTALIDLLRPIVLDLSRQLNELLDAAVVAQPGAGMLRVLRYPAFVGEEHSRLVRGLAARGAIRSAAHADLNALTILPPATEPGLEIAHGDGAWAPVDDVAGCLVVHAGRALHQRSDGRVAATVHRVRNPSPSEEHRARLALAFFVD